RGARGAAGATGAGGAPPRAGVNRGARHTRRRSAALGRRRGQLFGFFPRQALLGFADDAQQPPVLGLRQRPALHDLHGVAGVRRVLLVVDVADGPPADVLAVALVLDQPRDLHPAGLVHLVAGDDPDRHATNPPCLLPHRLKPPSPRPPSGRPAGAPAGSS